MNWLLAVYWAASGFAVATLALIAAKLSGLLAWSWWYVTLLVWGFWGLSMAVFLIALAVALFRPPR